MELFFPQTRRSMPTAHAEGRDGPRGQHRKKSLAKMRRLVPFLSARTLGICRRYGSEIFAREKGSALGPAWCGRVSFAGCGANRAQLVNVVVQVRFRLRGVRVAGHDGLVGGRVGAYHPCVHAHTPIDTHFYTHVHTHDHTQAGMQCYAAATANANCITKGRAWIFFICSTNIATGLNEMRCFWVPLCQRQAPRTVRRRRAPRYSRKKKKIRARACSVRVRRLRAMAR